MEISTSTGQRIVITFSSPTELGQAGKQKVISHVCAFLNSNGGDLVIAFSSQKYETKDLDQPVRTIEQWINSLIGTVTMSKKIKIAVEPQHIVINIKGSYSLITVDYNMFLPSHSQVNRVMPIETLEKIQEIIFGENMTSVGRDLPSSQQIFVKDEEIKLCETYSVQFKDLKDAPARCTTLADRVAGRCNKVLQYVSAFANYRGGVIYIGIDDKHLIKGELITENERDSVVRKLTNKINRMIWAGLEDGPQRGKHWDVHFYPVVDKKGETVESTFVVAIFVARCPGGVFLKEPESYHMMNGNVEKIKLDTWKEYFLLRRSPHIAHTDQRAYEKPNSALQWQRPIGRLQWSSIEIRKKYYKVNGFLIQLINKGSWKKFWACLEKEKANCNAYGVKLVILSKKITANFKLGNFKQAERGIAEYRRGLSQSEDRTISETREFLLNSALERSRGNMQESYQCAINGLELVEQIPTGILVVQYYSNLATVITVLLELESDRKNRELLKQQAIYFFLKAIDHLEDANDYLPSKSDQKQKVHINLAFLHLRSSFASGVRAEERVEDFEIEQAKKHLEAADQSVYEGCKMTNYRNCQYLLARSVWFYRRSQNLKADEIEARNDLLNDSFEYSNEASQIAIGCKFVEMLQSTSRHLQIFHHP